MTSAEQLHERAARVWRENYNTHKRLEYMRDNPSEFDCLCLVGGSGASLLDAQETEAEFLSRWRIILANVRGREFSPGSFAWIPRGHKDSYET